MWDQNPIPLIWLDGYQGQAVQVGNNASWMCRCGHVLSSPSWEHFGKAPATLDCPTCGKKWALDSPAVNKAPTAVREL